MRIALLHICDLHQTASSPAPLERFSRIVPAITSIEPLVECCIVAIAGDVAFSGKQEEYDIAAQCFEIIERDLKSARIPEVHRFAVPGNHDCDFTLHSGLRKALLAGIGKQGSSLAIEADVLDTLLKCQESFFDFEAKQRRQHLLASPYDRISRSHDVAAGGKKLQVHCYNTAVFSQLEEAQGELLVPLTVAETNTSFDMDCDLSISLFHHPYGWLESNNAVAFRRHVERSSDIILTGHQHFDHVYEKRQPLTDTTALYLEGDVFNDGGGHSGFNVVVIDLTEAKQKVAAFSWNGTLYTVSQQTGWEPFKKNLAVRHSFKFNGEFLRKLEDLGTGFTHSKKQTLLLDDLFVYPGLRRIGLLAAGKATASTIPSENVLAYVKEKRNVLILGSAQSGKTSLSKKLALDLQASGDFVPLLLQGHEVTTHKPEGVAQLLHRKFAEQYAESLLGAYSQAPPSIKLVVIDDWDRVKLTKRNQSQFLRTVALYCGAVVVLADDILQVEEIAQSKTPNPLADFEHLAIMQFGHHLRTELFRRWFTAGRDTELDGRKLSLELEKAENFVRTLLGRNLLPYYPIFILSVLQAIEIYKSTSTQSGSFGHIYEALITDALAQAKRDETAVDTKFTYIARLAYYLFKREQNTFTPAEFREVTQEYFELYKIFINPSVALQELVDARILVEQDSGYSFRYPYCYYYFVARYFSDHMIDVTQQQQLEVELKYMAERVYFDDYAHILVFVVYLTRNTHFINFLVDCADAIYSEQSPCDLESHVEFVNKLFTSKANVLLPAGDIEDHRAERDRVLDEFEEHVAEDFRNEKIQYEPSLPDITKLHIALKTLQLLGQILRNFPGSLLADMKVRIARSTYLLGLRSLRAVLSIAEDNLEELRTHVAELLREHKPFDFDPDDRKLAIATDEALVALTRACAYSIVKRVSHSVGMEDLSETYKAVAEAENRLTSIRLIDVTIKLDHFSGFPESDVIALHEGFKKNYFADQLLTDCVVNHFLLFEVDYRTRQRIAALLGITPSHAPFLTNPQKRLKAKTGE